MSCITGETIIYLLLGMIIVIAVLGVVLVIMKKAADDALHEPENTAVPEEKPEEEKPEETADEGIITEDLTEK